MQAAELVSTPKSYKKHLRNFKLLTFHVEMVERNRRKWYISGKRKEGVYYDTWEEITIFEK